MQLEDIHLNYPCTLKDGFDCEGLGIICTSCLEDGHLDIFFVLRGELLIREDSMIGNIRKLLLLISVKVRLRLLDR